MAMRDEAPQSIKKCSFSDRTRIQVWNLPPLPRASPDPKNWTSTSLIGSVLALLGIIPIKIPSSQFQILIHPETAIAGIPNLSSARRSEGPREILSKMAHFPSFSIQPIFQ